MEDLVLKAIRLKRLEKNYSQEYISSQLEMSQTNYGRIENGKTLLSIPIFLKMLSCLDIDVFEFFNFVEKLKEENN
jgi:transcriptional regulator with XRE-family HTH domain